MFRTYLLTTLRSLGRDWGYAFINIGGLVFGVSCFIVLALYLESELTYDRHVPNHENIYRVAVELKNENREDHLPFTSRFVGPLMKQDHPEIETVVRFFAASQGGRLILRHEDTRFFWSDAYLTDPEIFTVFDHEIVHGDPQTALQDPLSIAISEKVAKQYFGDRNPIGEQLATDTAAYTVTLVFADLRENTHLKYDVLLSYKRLDAFFTNVDVRQALWGLTDFTYVVMPDGYDPVDFSRIATDFYEKYMAERGRQMNATQRFYLEPLADIHLSSITEGDRPRGNLFYIYTFSAIALFVLLVACINYMNLATARSIQRAREVGMRKIIGATRRQLITQFIGESVTFAFLALMIAIVVVYMVLAWTPIDRLLGASLSLNFIERPALLLLLPLLAIVIGFLSGLYPAFYLAAIQPIAALRGSNKGTGARGGLLRKALVFMQFAISVGVIACTLLMAIQMQYLQSRPLGYDKDNVIIVSLIGADLLERVPFIKGELGSHPHIVSSTLSPNIPGEVIFTNLARIEMENGTESSQTVRVVGGDVHYIDVMGLELIEGRRFDPATPRDELAYVNETLVRKMGWENPIGKHIDNGSFRNRVVGVVRDFHYESLHMPVEPLYIFYNWLDFEGAGALNRAVAQSYLYIKTDGVDNAATLAYLSERFGEWDPEHPFEYRFLEDILASQYASERRQMQLIGIFATVCIIISCMGLFGLSAFTTSQRTREIGVRKILGASTTRIILLLFKDIVGLILTAALVASVISWYVISNWLTAFAYKDEINLVVFVFASLFCLGLAFLTVTVQSWRTASANPGVALRYEG